MVALNHDGAAGGLGSGFKERAAGRAGDLDVFVDQKIVEEDPDEFGVGDFFAVGVEARGAKFYPKILPKAGRAGGVGAGREAVVALLALAAGGVPAVIDGAAVDVLRNLFSPAVEELNLVAAHEVDAGVGAGGEQEIEFELEIAMVPGGDEVGAVFLGGIVDEDAVAREADEFLFDARIAPEAGCDLPICAERFEIVGDRRPRRLGRETASEEEAGDQAEG